MKVANLRIGELANRTNSTVETIRHYEREGLLPEPSRTDSNYRMYGETHIERLLLIRHCRSLDMSLDEIRTLLKFCDAPKENCEEIDALIDAHIAHVTSRIADLKALENQLRSLRRLCDTTNSAKHCAILKDLTGEASQSDPSWRTGCAAKKAGTAKAWSDPARIQAGERCPIYRYQRTQ